MNIKKIVKNIIFCEMLGWLDLIFSFFTENVREKTLMFEIMIFYVE